MLANSILREQFSLSLGRAAAVTAHGGDNERFGAEFRVEFFNLFNHPIIANPFGSSNTSFLGSDPSGTSHFGCGCSTPDVAAGNPLVGSGSSRVMQLGLKFTF